MPKHFVIVTADFKKSPDSPTLKRTLDRAADWIQFFPNQWLLWTSSSASTWYSRLKPMLSPGSHIFVCELNVDERGGRMPSGFWEFVRKYSASAE